jgi:S-DNA-T family DNA segregation ATPase FtsK/SpoIIIE
VRRKKSSYKGVAEQRKGRLGTPRAALCLGIGVCLVLLCSCISFDIGDWPSKFVYPHNDPTANRCGWIGAFCAYYLLYYIGPGVFVIFATAICFLVAGLAHRPAVAKPAMSGVERPAGQPVFRAVGLAFMTVAASTSFYYLWPHRFYNFPMGSGGVLGVGVAQLLRSNFAWLGTLILVSAIWVVGFLLLADTFVLAVLGGLGRAVLSVFGIAVPAISVAREHSQSLSEIWQKLSTRSVARLSSPKSKSEPAFGVQGAGLSSFTRDVRFVEKPPALASQEAAGGKPEEKSEPATDGAEAPSAAPADRELKLIAEKAHKPGKSYEPQEYKDYVLPPMELLAEPESGFGAVQEKVVKAKAGALEKLLAEFDINVRVVAADTGPVVTMFELELAAGVKVSQISTLANDMARALGVGAVRVVAPLPGKHTIGIEVPNSEKEKVRFKSMMQLAGDAPKGMEIPLFLGKDSSGSALVSDLTKMPHLLIAGTTGSGKSVCINSIITGIMLTKRPDEAKLILIDPKMVEMTAFNIIPHLMCPIVTETQMAVQILEWATVTMDERYELLAEARVKNVAEYNTLGAEEIIRRFAPTSEEEKAKIPKRLPYIVIVIDELADLMMTAAKEIEAYIVRLAQKSRAVGIHIVLATQRPQATVVTGLIKSNMPCRIGFRVAAKMDSRIILDQNGAETLLGEGDMLFLKPGTSDLIRAQGTFVDEAEIKRIVSFLKNVAEPQFHPELTGLKRVDAADFAKDELFDEAARIILETQRGSVSLLQRRLNIGYARASRIIEMMAVAGILGEYKGSQAREVMMTLEEWERIREQMETEAEAGAASGSPEDSAEPAHVSESQRGYVSVDGDDR